MDKDYTQTDYWWQVKYDANGGDAETSVPTDDHYYSIENGDNQVPVQFTPAPAKSGGYQFLGWSDTKLADPYGENVADPAVQYPATAAEDQFFAISAASKTLYAVWQESAYQISADPVVKLTFDEAKHILDGQGKSLDVHANVVATKWDSESSTYKPTDFGMPFADLSTIIPRIIDAGSAQQETTQTIRYQVSAKTSKYVDVIVVVSDNPVVVENGYSIAATPIVDLLKGADASNLINLANAHAWKNGTTYDSSATLGDDANVNVVVDGGKTVNTSKTGGTFITFNATVVEDEVTVVKTSAVSHFSVTDSTTGGPSTKNEGLLIDGDDFSINLTEVQALTGTDAYDKAGVHYWFRNGDDASDFKAEDTVVSVSLAGETTSFAAITKAGGYKVTFTQDDISTDVTMSVEGGNTIGPVNGLYIDGDDFIVTLAEAKTLSSLFAYGKAGVHYWFADGTTEGLPTPLVTDVSVAGVDLDKITKTGKYDVTFTYRTAPTLKTTVKMTVYDDGEVNGKASTYANNFSISIAEANDLTQTEAEELAEVYGTDKFGAKNTTFTLGLEQFKAINDTTVKGEFDLTFTGAVGTDDKATAATIKVTVYDGGVKIDKESTYANSFNISLDELSKLDNEDAIERSGANGTSTTGAPYSGFTADVTELGKIKATEVKGGFPLTINGESVTKADITVTVYEHGEKKGKASTYANDFTISVAEAKTLTDALANEYADATGTKNDGTKKSSFAVDEDLLKAINDTEVRGEFPLTFEGENETEATINVTVYDGGGKDEKSKAATYANNFSISLDDLETFDGPKALELSSANSTNIDGSKFTGEFKVDAEQLKAIKDTEIEGEFPLNILGAQKKDSIEYTLASIKVTVYDNGEYNGKASTHANNFRILLADAENLTQEDAEKLATVIGTDKEGKVNKDFTLGDGQLKAINDTTVKGEFALTFTGAAGTDEKPTVAKITVTVYDNGDVKDKASTFANNFPLSVAEAKALTYEQAVKLAAAVGTDADGKPYTDLALGEGQLELINAATEKGEFDLTFIGAESNKGEITKAETTVTVYDNGSTGENGSLYANNFGVKLVDVKNLTDELVKGLAKIIATDKDGVAIAVEDIAVSIDGKAANYASITKTGSYVVTFTTEDGREVQSIMSVTDVNTGGPSVTNPGLYIDGNDFAVTLDAAKALNGAAAYKAAGVHYWYKNGADASAFKAENTTVTLEGAKSFAAITVAGPYKVTFTQGDIHTTVIMSVKGPGTGGPLDTTNGGLYIDGANFSLDKEVVNAWKNDKTVLGSQFANIRFWFGDGTTVGLPAVTSVTVAKEKAWSAYDAGVYTLKFTYKSPSTGKTITSNVKMTVTEVVIDDGNGGNGGGGTTGGTTGDTPSSGAGIAAPGNVATIVPGTTTVSSVDNLLAAAAAGIQNALGIGDGNTPLGGSTGKVGEGTGTTSMTENGVPLFAGFGGEYWALANLFFAAAGLMLVLYGWIRNREKKNWLAAGSILAAASVILFLIIEDITHQQMAMFDAWSVLFAIIFSSVLFTTTRAIRTRADFDEVQVSKETLA